MKTEIRIVAGSLRGRKLSCRVSEDMRPTPQMVREALFSILGNAIPGRLFVDIFAGTTLVEAAAFYKAVLLRRLVLRCCRQGRRRRPRRRALLSLKLLAPSRGRRRERIVGVAAMN